MRRWATLVAEHADELAHIETANMGMPIASSRWCAETAAEVVHYYAGSIDKHTGSTIPVAGGVTMTFHEPLGVVGLITPWNFPMLIATWKLGPALACGNTVVIKPSELTPLSTIRLGELALEAGIPDGVLNVVVGTGAEVGWRFVEHPLVHKIGFTGSTAVGKRIMAGAAEQVKRVTLEFGGKSANIVFADADLEAAAAVAPAAVFDNSGQDCCSRSRLLVQRTAYDRFVELFIEASQAFTVGDPLDASTAMGPLVTAAHKSKVEALLASEDVLWKGSAPSGPGWWMPCHVVAPAPDSRLFRDEISARRRAHAVRHRGGRDHDRQRYCVRTVGLDLDPRRQSGDARRSCGRDRHAVGQQQLVGAVQHAVRWLQTERNRPRAVDGCARSLQRAEDRVLGDVRTA